MQNQKNDSRAEIRRWQARHAGKAAADTLLAGMLAELERRASAAYDAYFDRLKVLLTREEYMDVMQAWDAEQDTPAALWAKMDADPEARKLSCEGGRLLWLLDSARRHGVPSEHYVYSQTGGKMRGPNGER